MRHHPRSRSRAPVAAAAFVLLTLLGGSAAMTISLLRGEHGPQTEEPSPRQASATAARPTRAAEPADATGQPGIRRGALEADLARLRAAPKATIGSPLARITGDATSQPDLYATAFAEQLLTQDYRRPRDAWVSWVQAESARTDEPLVVGLIPPELRGKWAVFSVTDASDGPAPIPGAGEWAKLGHQGGRTTVEIERVTEPMAWTNAVEAGRITDPGITARVVSAQVTLTTVVEGRIRSEVSSVELGLEFEGPPTRHQWGFVGMVTYTAIPLGSS